MERAGAGFPYNPLRARPADGTFRYGAKGWNQQELSGTGKLFWISDGAAVPVNEDHAGPSTPSEAFTDISAVERAGTGGV